MSDSPEVAQQSGAHQGGTEWLKRLEQVDRHVASTVEKVVRDLQDLAAAAEEGAVGQLLEATAKVDAESSQTEILETLLGEGRRFARRTAFFLTRPGQVRGWVGRGFDNGASLEGAEIEYSAGSAWERLATRPGAIGLDADDCAAICTSFGAAPGGQGVLIPFILRGQLGGALYADRLPGEGSPGVASLQLLTHAAAQAIETAAVRGRGSSPTLRSSAEAGESDAVSMWAPPESAGGEVAEGETGAVGATAMAAAAAAVVTEAVADETAEEVSAVEETEAAAVPSTQEIEAAAVPSTEEEEIAAPEEEETVELAAEEPEPEPAVDDDAPMELVEESADPAEEEALEPEPEVDFEMVSDGEEPASFEAEEVTEEELEVADLTHEPELEDTSDLWADDDSATLDDEPATFDDEPTLLNEPAPQAAPPAPPVLDPSVGQETVRLDIAALQGQMPAAGQEPVPPAPPAAQDTDVAELSEEETAKVPQWEVESVTSATEPEPSFELEPDDEPVTAAMSTPDFDANDAIGDEDPTIMTSRADLGVEPPSESPMAGGYVPPAPEPEPEPEPSSESPPVSGFASPPPAPKPDATGTTQVVPPTDIQGPGSAFSAESQEETFDGEEALHEEARRLARLLVSEIKLYNEEIIEEGRRSGNIYERLKDDIDRSRQMYEERIDPRLKAGGNDYFRQELVQRLAGGDQRLLGY